MELLVPLVGRLCVLLSSLLLLRALAAVIVSDSGQDEEGVVPDV